ADLKRRAPSRKRAKLQLAAPTVRHAPASVRELVEPGQRVLAAAGAASTAGMTTHVLPFFPAHWPLGIAAVAAALTAWSERVGLAFCLAVPVLPLGNYSFGLAALYGILAVAGMAACWKTPRAGLLAALGAALGPAGALGLLPIMGLIVRWPARRAVCVAAAVLVGAGIGGATRIGALGVPATNSLLAAGRAVARELGSHPQILATAGALALGAAVVPLVRGRGPFAAAAYGLVVGGLTVVPAPHAANVPLLVVTAATALAIGLEPYAKQPRRPRAKPPVEETTATVAAPPPHRAATGRR